MTRVFIKDLFCYPLMILKLVGIVIVVTLVITCLYFAKNPVSAQQANSNSTTMLKKQNVSFSNMTGSIVSLQNGQDGKPMWIIPGKWQIVFNQSHKLTANQTNNPTPKIIFNAGFSVTKVDGTVQHKHNDVSDFQLIGNPVKDNKTDIFNGTATVSVKDGERNVYHQVRTSIKIMNNATISIWLDPRAVEYQFGYTPIYGTAKPSPSTSKITSVQISK